MNLKNILSIFIMLLSPLFYTQQIEKQEFEVKGSCSMCKTRIENTAKNAGAITAIWDINTQKITIETNPEKVSFDQILKQIAQSGHDNEAHQAPDEIYQNLPACCHYRLGEENEPHQNNNPTHEHQYKKNENEIEGVSIVAHKATTSISKKEVGLTFNIGSKELLKAACCNLSESFETNATVDVSFNNAVTGGKQLKMLGLDQKYTSLTKEQLPEIRGLASAYGLNFIPGRWIGGIQLTKGGSTVVNGYESITGQINTELLKTHDKDKTSLNIFTDFDNRQEINIIHISLINSHWNQSILLHGNITHGNKDHNKDNFLDRPKGHQVNLSYLLNYVDLDHTGWASHTGINFLLDKRTAGQIEFNEKIAQTNQSAYGAMINLSHFQLWNKTGYIFQGKPYQSIGWMNKFSFHQQDSFFGLKNYFGEQKTFYSNLVFESIFGNTNHKYKTGISFLHDIYNEDFLTQTYQRTESVPGLFFEYTLTGEKYTLVAGVRTDFHNLAGTQFTPRLNFKYDLTPKTILRISGGKGFRTANIFAENHQYFASNRTIEVRNNNGKIYGLKPEIAWNYGLNIQQEFKFFNRKSTFIIDFFRTDFTQQVLADLDTANKLIFYNLNGKSFANSFQVQWDSQPMKNFDVNLTYKHYDVQANFIDGKKEIPFISKHRAFINLSYSTTKTDRNRFWSANTTLNWIGKQRLPNTQMNPTAFQLPNYSSTYFTLNAQISRNFRDKIRIYAGAENLTNKIQDKAIIDAQNPFGNYFDASIIYAPIMPRNFYIGLDIDF